MVKFEAAVCFFACPMYLFLLRLSISACAFFIRKINQRQAQGKKKYHFLCLFLLVAALSVIAGRGDGLGRV